MEPALKLMIKSLRAGKPEKYAFREYCWAKCVLPISRDSLQHHRGDPFACLISYPGIAMARAMEAIEQGLDDDFVEAEFEGGLKTENTIFRVMRKDERPEIDDLIRAMSTDEQMEAVKYIGIRAVAQAIVSRP